jgi:hypothetical protein
MPEQRNAYKGSPARSWVRIVLVSATGVSTKLDVLADTGSPCSLIVSDSIMSQFNLGVVPGMQTNFGPLGGGWLRIRIPDLGFDATVLGYSSDAVVDAGKGSHSDFAGLAGLPLLRLLEYGGDADTFWIRRP